MHMKSRHYLGLCVKINEYDTVASMQISVLGKCSLSRFPHKALITWCYAMAGGHGRVERVRMAERSKALRSGRSLPWRRGFESHFWHLLLGIGAYSYAHAAETPVGPWLKYKNFICIGRESNPGLPRGRREFYHWTTNAWKGHFEDPQNFWLYSIRFEKC